MSWLIQSWCKIRCNLKEGCMNYFKYYYQSLSPGEKKIYEALEKGLVSRADSIRVMGSGIQVKKILPMVYLDNPQFFYVDNTQLSLADGGLFCIVHPCYYKTEAQCRSIEAYLQKIAGRFIDEIRKKRLNNQMTVKYVHDFIIRNTSYAKENQASGDASGDVSTIVGVFCNQRAVCLGIALAAKWLLDLAGIPSGVMEGCVSEGMEKENNHAWNIVSINDLWYHMDTTMDMGASISKRQISYDFFLRSDAVFRRLALYVPPGEMADIEKYSYFASSHTVLRDKTQIESYIKNCIRNKRRRIYFELGAGCEAVSREQIGKYLSSVYIGSYRIRMNVKLNIYDIFLQ